MSEKITVKYAEVKVNSPKYKSWLVVFNDGRSIWMPKKVCKLIEGNFITMPEWLAEKHNFGTGKIQNDPVPNNTSENNCPF